MREKLIDLLETVPHPKRLYPDLYVDYLIANGVTFATENNVGGKWIHVTERLPEEEGWYQVYTAPDKGYKSINKAMFRKGFEWNNFTPYWHGAGGTWGNVTHWMPLPEPPEGE